MNRKTIIIGSAILSIILLFAFIAGNNTVSEELITTNVKRADFEILVSSSGQLESENQIKVMPPERMNDRSLGIHNLKIIKMVEEGTFVDSGDYVATLDHETVKEALKKVQDDMDKVHTEFLDAKIDSNLNLSNLRDQIINAELDLTEKKITIDESIYESPSIQKKAKMDYGKAKRKLEQQKNTYKLKQQQEKNKVDRKLITYRQLQDRYKKIEELYNSLIIYAPKAGLITYVKNPWGTTTVGSEVRGRSPVAEIPNMSNVISRTYINEIDISEIKKGLKVKIGIDAFPEKEFTGEVISIANVGQSMPNSDARVFEVKIKVFGADNDLKPAMTTSNIIYAKILQDTLFIPSECVFENDSLQYVYVKGRNIKKQIVKLGDNNENFVLVAAGVKEGEELCLIEPSNADEIDFSGLEIYQQILEEAATKQKQAELDRIEFEKKQKAKQAQHKMPSGMPMGLKIVK